jgi:dUTP pyrophosphatase
LQIAVPRGTYGRIASRSGLAAIFGISVGGGVIDADYRGNVRVILFNHSDVDYLACKGDRVAQLICEKINTADVVLCTTLDNTARGAAGFGSTGTAAIKPHKSCEPQALD